MEETIVISLGGSLIIPDELDINFLKEFRTLILSQVAKGKKFVIITGGGKICRKYNEAVEKITTPTKENLDWLGIAVTRLNAEFLKIVFGEFSNPKIIMDPDVISLTDKPIIFGGGWKPGNSSDLAAVHYAISVGAKKLINMSNIDYVYEKDPKKYPQALKIEKISWVDFQNLLPKEWDPGLNVPFDPVASKMSEEAGLEVMIMNGKPIDNLAKCLNGEKFQGTIIS